MTARRGGARTGTPLHRAWDAALAHHQAGRLAEAERIYSRILIAQSSNAPLLGNLGAAFRGQGKLEAAIACYHRALAIDPGNSQVHGNLGNALKDMGRLADAEACYRRAAESNPDFAEAHYNLANALKEQGKLVEAEDAFVQALKINPDYLEACIPLSAVQESLGKPEQARDTLNLGIRNKPFYSDFCKGKPQADILIFMGVQDCGFGLSDDYRHKISGGHFSTAEFIKNEKFTRHVFYILDDNLEKMGGKLPGHDIVINTIACPDREHVSLKTLSRYLGANPHAPLINHPDEVLKTTRDNNCVRLKRLKGITFPKTIRLSPKDASSGDIAALIRKKRLIPPFIIRRTGTQTAVSTRLLENFDELGGYLAETKGEEYYVIEFVKCLYKKKYFRKLRMFSIDGELFPVVCHIDETWNVHGGNRKTMMKKHKWMRNEEKKYLEDCAGYIGAKNHKILKSLYDKIKLDFFGIDFNLLEDNSILIYELNPAMRHSFEHAQHFPYLKPHLEDISKAFEAMVLKKSGKE